MTCGVSETKTRELTQSLGLKLGKASELTGQLSSKFGIATTISEQRNVTGTVRLQNDGTRTYRLYARWFVRHEISVQRLEMPAGRDWQEMLKGTVEPDGRNLLCNVNFLTPDTAAGTAVLTYCEIEK